VTDMAIALPIMPAATPAPTRSGVPTTGGEPSGSPADAPTPEEGSTDPFAALLAAVVASVLPPPMVPDAVVTTDALGVEAPVFDPVLSAGVALGQPISEVITATTAPIPADAGAFVADVDAALTTSTAPSQSPDATVPNMLPVDPSPLESLESLDPGTSTGIESSIIAPEPAAQAPVPAPLRAPVEGAGRSFETEVEVKAAAVASPAGVSAADAPAPIAQPGSVELVTPLATPLHAAPVETLDAPAAATPAAPRPAAPPAAQIVSHVSPLLQRPDGSYHVSVRLRPEELGGVRIDVHLVDGQVSLQLRADTQVGHEALRTSLPQLRHELEAAGVSPGTLDLGDWAGNQQSPADTSRRQTAPTFTAEPLPAELVGLIDAAAEDAVLDVRM
jgi:hypothetical protein